MIIISEELQKNYYSRLDTGNLENIPNSLKEIAAWVCWREAPARNPKAKPRKVPINPATLANASSTDPATWGTFSAAVDAFMSARNPELAGVGFVFSESNGFAGIDADDCRNPETGELDSATAELVRLIGSYAEVSPSLKGIKIYVKAGLSGEGNNFEFQGREYQIYDTGRYFTVTGLRIPDSPLAIWERQQVIDSLLPPSVRSSAPAATPKPRTEDPIAALVDAIPDDELIARIENSRQGEKFKALMAGSKVGYAGYFAASGALCTILASWTRLNPERIDRIYRASEMCAPREWWWDDRAYRGGRTRAEVSLEKAISLASGGWLYDPSEQPELAALVEEFNDRFYVVEDFGGKCRVCWEDGDTSFRLDKPLLNHQSFEDFRNRFVHKKVVVGWETKGREKIKVPVCESKGKAWLSHPSRLQYQEVRFAPGVKLPTEFRNLWRGFAYEPQKGKCSKYLAHVRNNICQGNEEYYDWLIRWMAYAVRNPAEQGHVAIVLRGLKGTGKNVFSEAFNDLWGRHGIVLSNEKHVMSNFNAHFLGKCSLVADEAFFAADHKQARLLKGLITGNTIAIESKGVNTIIVPNFLHVIIIGNDEWLVSATGDERRFFALECGDRRRENYDYFAAIAKELENGGYQALLYHLLYEVDLTGFNVRCAPHTAVLRDQMAESVEDAPNLWLECLMSGTLPGEQPREVVVPAVKNSDGTVWLNLDSFIERSAKRNPRLWGRISSKKMSTLFRNLGFKPTKRPKGEVRRWEIPALPECRRIWDRKKFEAEWPPSPNPDAENGDDWDVPEITKPVELEPDRAASSRTGYRPGYR